MTIDYIEEMEKAVLTADAFHDESERRRFLQGKYAFFKEAFRALEEAGDWSAVGMMLRVLSDEPEQSPAALFASQTSEKLCKALDENREEIDERLVKFTMSRAWKLRQMARSGDHIGKYTDRHRFVETAIRLVWNLCDKSDQWPFDDCYPAEDAYRFIAECYLIRSGFALAKGSSVPAKKLEALTKAMTWAEKTGEKMDVLKIRILLEQDLWDENFSTSTLGEALKTFIQSEESSLSDAVRLAANDRIHNLIRESDDPESWPPALLVRLRENDKALLQNPPKGGLMTPLYLACAGFRNGTDTISEMLTSAVEKLENCLQTQKIWDRTVDLLKDVAEAPGFEGKWEKAALAAWDKCRDAEKKIKLGLQLRWYWSRYRTLYGLALIAALNTGEYTKAAKIIDSAKSRPTIKMQDAERSLAGDDKEFYRLYVESDALFSTDAYSTQYERLKKFPAPSEREARDIEDIPEGWTVVHFYIHSLDNVGALLAGPESDALPEHCKKAAAALVSGSDGSFFPVHLDVDGAWAAFKRWREDRRTFEIEETHGE